MMSFKVFVSAAALTLLAASVESSFSEGRDDFDYTLSGQELTDLYNSRVKTIERMRRPMGSSSSGSGPISHSGVRVTLDDDSQWLIHKGDRYGRSSQTVVVEERFMSSKWKNIAPIVRCSGTKTVADLVDAGGAVYDVFSDNCHHASRRMNKC
ncbi:uncharacterized protein [Leuresthes tenuis]|uniref:uncharacterized protein n=1 Tax=Leuresthes tenuis TaxID=355514 RepID=UPI003B511884